MSLESQEYLADSLPPTLAPLFAFLATATTGETKAADSLPPTLAPLFAYLATATTGETEAVEDSLTGATVPVTAGRTYHAASGRFCRLFRVTPPRTYEDLTEGLACRDERGHWTMSALLINPEDLAAPRLRYP